MLWSRPSFPLFPRPVRILSDFSKGVDTPRLVLWQPLPLVVVVILVLVLLLRFLLFACTRLGAEARIDNQVLSCWEAVHSQLRCLVVVVCMNRLDCSRIDSVE
jgi:hypothetical protein